MTKLTNKISRHQRIRSKVKGSKAIPRISVFRSNKYFYVQLIDDETGKTIMSIHDATTSKGKKVKTDGAKIPKGKSGKASLLGQVLGKQALEKGILKVVFDRGGYKYHGRVKALAEALREAGLKF